MIKLSRSRSNLFLIELAVAILSFALCAGICMRVFAGASLDLRESERILVSVSNAENAAELYKHYSGDLDLVARVLGGSVVGNVLKICYDKDWNTCDASCFAYVLTVTKSDYSELGKAAVTVARQDGETLFSLTVTVYGGEAR